MDIRILLKSEAGKYETHTFETVELHDLLKKSADKDGNIKREIVIYQEAYFKVPAGVNPYTDGIPWVLSSFALDSDMERVDPHGWNLKDFKKNPVMLWSHEWYTPAIGTIVSPRVKDDQLIGKAVFDPPEVDKFAAMIAEKALRGTIRAGSVGFRSDRIEITEEGDKEEAYLIHRKQTLREFSIANLGANKDAMAEQRMEFPVSEEEIADVLIENIAPKGRSYIEELLNQPKPDKRKTSAGKRERNTSTHDLMHLLRNTQEVT